MLDTENEVKNSTQEAADEDNSELGQDKRVYELGYLLVPSIVGEEIPAIYGNLKEVVVKEKGDIISDEMPKMINLAYTISKVISNSRQNFKNAYFGWIKFFMTPEQVLSLKSALAMDKNLIRFLIIKTVKENTISSRRFMYKDMPKRRTPGVSREGKSEGAAPINKEEIDKEIDALVAN